MAGNTVQRVDHKDILDFTYSNMVKIRLDPGQSEQVVDREVICKFSTLVREKLHASGSQEVTIPSIFQFDFKIYLDWLHTGTLGTKNGLSNEFAMLVELYFLGVRLKDARFRNDIITAVSEKGQEDNGKHLPGRGSINTTYMSYCDTTSTGAVRLQELIVEMYPRNAPAEFEKIKNAVRPDFARDLCSRLLKLRPAESGAFEKIKASDFHEPVSSEEDGGEEPAGKRRRKE